MILAMELGFLFCSTTLTLILALLTISSTFTDAQVGVCYGRNGESLPSATETVELFKQKNIRRMRLYSPDHDVLDALRGSDIEVMLDLPNPDLQRVASSQSEADTWVRDNVVNYADNVRFRYISVGNEVKISDPFAQFLGPALENIDRAVSGAGLGGRIKVSTAIDTGVLAEPSSPPSRGLFRGEVMVLMDPIIRFLVTKQSPLLVNIYPYFSIFYNDQIPLEFALFEASTGFVSDPPNTYQNLFDAILDAMYSALEKSGGGSLEIVVSETGWPTRGGPATSVENARKYNNNLVQHVNNGTPKRQGKAIETYIFAMYDENKKDTDYERSWGLFLPDKQPKYDVNFN